MSKIAAALEQVEQNLKMSNESIVISKRNAYLIVLS